MTTRRRFTGEFKARVALEGPRGQQTVQETSKQKVHRKVHGWKGQMIEGGRGARSGRTASASIARPRFAIFRSRSASLRWNGFFGRRAQARSRE